MPEWVLGMPCMWLDQNGSAEVGITWWAARDAGDHDDRVTGDLDDRLAGYLDDHIAGDIDDHVVDDQVDGHLDDHIAGDHDDRVAGDLDDHVVDDQVAGHLEVHIAGDHDDCFAGDLDDRVAGDLDDHNTPLSQRPKNLKCNLLLYSCSNKILIKYKKYSHFNDCHQPLVLRFHSSPTWSTMASLALGGVILMIRCLITQVPRTTCLWGPRLVLDECDDNGGVWAGWVL